MALNQLNVTIGAKVKDFQSALKSIEKDLGRFQRNFETIGKNLTQSISLPLVALGASAVKAFGEFESLEKAFVAVAAEGTNVGQEIERLRKIAEAPGLGFAEAVKASTRLQAVGLQAGEAARVIEQYGNAVARSGGGRGEFDGAILALTQIASKGKISAEEINQLNERVFEIRPALKAAFGTSDSEQLQKLGISSAEFIARTTEELAKLERVQGGLANAFENFGDTARQALTSIGKEISVAIDLPGILNKISTALGNAANFFRNLSPEAKKAIVQFGLIAIAAGPVLIAVAKLSSVFSLAVTGFKILTSAALNFVKVFALITSPIGLTVAGITALIAGLLYLYDRFEGVRKVVNGVIDGFRALGRLAREVAGNIADGFRALASGNFKEAANNFKDAFSASNAFNIGKTFVGGFQDGFEDGSNRIEGTINRLKSKLAALTQAPTVTGASGGTTPFAPTGDPNAPGARNGGAVSQVQNQARELFAPLEELDQPPKVLELSNFQLERVSTLLDLAKQNSAGFTESIRQQSDALALAAANANQFAASLDNTGTASRAVEFIGEVAGAASNALKEAALSGETSLKKLGAAALRAAADFVRSKLIEAVAAFLADAFKKLGIFGTLLAGAGVGIVSALFNGAISKITAPKLAEGGIVTQLGTYILGDNPSGKEAVIPFEKIGSFIDQIRGNDGDAFIAQTRISGDDLLFLVSRADARQNRIR